MESTVFPCAHNIGASITDDQLICKNITAIFSETKRLEIELRDIVGGEINSWN